MHYTALHCNVALLYIGKRSRGVAWLSPIGSSVVTPRPSCDTAILNTVTHSDTQSHTVTHSDTQSHTVTHSYTQHSHTAVLNIIAPGMRKDTNTDGMHNEDTTRFH